MQEIADRVYRIRLPLPWAVDFMPFAPDSINVYVIHRGSELALVDTGFAGSDGWQVLTDALDEIGFSPGQLTDVVLTHFHPDHSGLVDDIVARAPAVRVHVHPCDRALIVERHDDVEKAARALVAALRAHGLPADERFDPQTIHLDTGAFARRASDLSPELRLGDETWLVHWTPGHTPGHIIVQEPNKGIVLGGDLLLPATTSNVSFYPGTGRNPLADYRASLQLLSDLRATAVWPGHGSVIDCVDARIGGVLRQQERKLSKIVDSVTAQPCTAYELARRLWDSGRREMDASSRRLALTESVAFLLWLESTSQLSSHPEPKGRVWAPA